MLALLDADDYWFPDKRQRQGQVMRERPDLVLLFDIASTRAASRRTRWSRRRTACAPTCATTERIRHRLPPYWDDLYRQRIAGHLFDVGWHARQRGDGAAARAAYRESGGLAFAIAKSCVPVGLSARLHRA